MSAIFFFWVDVRSKENPSVVGPFTDNPEGAILVECGSHSILAVPAEDPIAASSILLTWIDRLAIKCNVKILPIPLDNQFMRDLFHNARVCVKGMYLVSSMIGDTTIPVPKLKQELNRTIQQNDKWSRKLRTLFDEVVRYEANSSPELAVRVREQMYELGIRPDGIMQ